MLEREFLPKLEWRRHLEILRPFSVDNGQADLGARLADFKRFVDGLTIDDLQGAWYAAICDPSNDEPSARGDLQSSDRLIASESPPLVAMAGAKQGESTLHFGSGSISLDEEIAAIVVQLAGFGEFEA